MQIIHCRFVATGIALNGLVGAEDFQLFFVIVQYKARGQWAAVRSIGGVDGSSESLEESLST